MFELKINAKNTDELNHAVERLAGLFHIVAPSQKTLAEFGLTEIVDFLAEQGIAVVTVERDTPKPEEPQTLNDLYDEEEAKKQDEAKPEPKKTKAKAKPKVEEASKEEVSVTGGPIGADAKKQAIQRIMSVYHSLEGKKVSKAVLTKFGVNNYHLIEDTRGGELLEAVEAAIKSAGL